MHTESKIQGNNDASCRGQTNTASRRGGNSLSQRREGKQGKNQIVVSTSRDTGYLRIDSHLLDASKPNAENRDAFQLTRNSLDTFHQRDKRCHVCRDFTAARCDHKANGYTWLSNVFKIARACSSHAMHGQTRLLKIRNKFPWKHSKSRADFKTREWKVNERLHVA